MDETLASIILNRFVGPALKVGLAGLLGILAVHGFTFDSALADDFTKALLPLLFPWAISVWSKFQTAKVIKTAIAASPGTPVAVVKANATSVPAALHLFSLLLAMGLLSQACAGVKPPANVGAEGTVAWYGIQVTKGVAVIREAAISGETAGVFKRNDVIRIVQACKIADTATGDLSTALAAGASATGAKAKALAEIRAALADLPGQLSPAAAEKIAPFVGALQGLLGVIEKLPFFDAPAPVALLPNFAPVLA